MQESRTLILQMAFGVCTHDSVTICEVGNVRYSLPRPLLEVEL